MLGEMVIALGYATQKDINEALCDSLGIDFVDMRETEISDDVLSMLDENIMRKYTLVPLGDAPDNPGAIRVAMADPTNILAMDDINIVTGKQVVPVLANATDINAFLDKAFGQKQAQSIVDLYKKEQGETVREETKEDKARREEIENAPIVQLINSVIEQAVRQRASDIHIEPMERDIRVRYRKDGNLREIIQYDNTLLGAITTRIKIMSGMDISEKRKPQDGRITINVDGREYDIRVSNLPTVYGEKCVMRIASKEGFNIDKSKLGLTPADLKVFDDILKNPHGIILVTGPTGSAKSTNKVFLSWVSISGMTSQIICFHISDVPTTNVQFSKPIKSLSSMSFARAFTPIFSFIFFQFTSFNGSNLQLIIFPSRNSIASVYPGLLIETALTFCVNS